MRARNLGIGIVILGLCLIQSSFSATHAPVERPKIGLVLSGGGAKGFAHVGVLKLLDSLQIPIDYIAGTSMGGIAGALYSIGYTGYDLEKLAHRNDWQTIFSDRPPRPDLPFFQKEQMGRYQLEFGMKGVKPVPPTGLIFGQKVSLLFLSLTFPYEHITNFDHLPIPFRCVAVDLVTGNQVVLKSGSLAKAMRSTMAIPTVFSPVEWGDSLLVDGGLINNLPVDVVKEMGADIVIAVDVQSPLLERKKLTSALAVLEQTVSLVGIDRVKENLKKVDILIRPQIDEFSAADFDADKINAILQRGDEAARGSVGQLVALKEKYQLQRMDDANYLRSLLRSPRIYSIQILGQTTVPFESLRSQINLKINDIFDPIALNKRLAELRASGRFESIDYEVVPLSEDYVNLYIRVKEKQMPIINRIAILDNQSLPFSFLYRLLGFKPGDKLDLERLNRRILDMYGLGYFELITYEVEPAPGDRVNLTVRVTELPFRRLRVGLRYDDRHRLVAAVSLQATNFLINGLRLEDELQFAGLFRFRFKAFYPSRALNLPIYPFARFDAKDIPTDIFDESGHRIAEYKDRSMGIGFGAGLVLAKSLNTEIEYHYEAMNVKPNIAVPDPLMFPSWRQQLRKIQANLNIDVLDDVLLPRSGYQLRIGYEAGLPELKSQVSYGLIQTSLNVYATFHRRHTTRMFAFSGMSWKNLPLYKFMNLGRPETFVGMEYDQLFASQLSILRFDYRYEFKKDIFFKFIGNGAFYPEYKREGVTYKLHNLYGAGVGVMLISPVGPIEVIVSRGDKNYTGPHRLQHVVYVTLGYKF
ncbi:MAG: patatin-like phospholipase family protein [candidate division KSB1 bacterium]|nr:patatin-like phospholipase family protein [candidate division KSB1 bacterium]